MRANGDALRRWSQLHDGYDVDRSRLVRGWLLLMHCIALPLVRLRVPPNAVTLAGVVAAAAATAVTRPVSAALVLVTAVCDGLDGAVAIQRGRISRHGTLIDHGADRVTDVLFAVALWHAGADLWLVVAQAVLVIGYESARSRARRRGATRALVTVGERPIRVVITVVGIAVAPSVGATAVAVACLVSVLQLKAAGSTSGGAAGGLRGR